MLTLTLVTGVIIGISLNASAQEQSSIPSWIKNIARYWAEGQIDDSEYFNGMQHLIKNKIITIPQTTLDSNFVQKEIPSWIRNAPKSWASGDISDDDFKQSLKWLISNHYIIISELNTNSFVTINELNDLNNKIIGVLDNCMNVTSSEGILGCSETANKTIKFCNTLQSNSMSICSDEKLQYLSKRPHAIQSNDLTENELSDAIDNSYIPSENLLDFCTNKHVLDQSYVVAKSKCDHSMNIMMSEYCHVDPPTQYAGTLCRDSRVDLFFGVPNKTENIPTANSVAKFYEVVSIGQLRFVGITLAGTTNTFQIESNMTNLGDTQILINKTNFKIIDEKGNISTATDALYHIEDKNGKIIEIHDLEKIPPHSELRVTIWGVTQWYEHNILEIDFESKSKYVELNNR